MRAVTLLVFCLGALPAVALTLAADGGRPLPIVLAEGAIASETTAAQELATWLGKATGATFAVVAEADAPAGAAIRVGPTALAKASGLVPEGPEAWRIKTEGDQLVITGGRPRGTLYGAYQFLEREVGVRWYTPWSETVPNRPTLEVGEIDLQGAPAFHYRDLYDELPAPKIFAARNRINGHFTGLGANHGGTVAYGPPYHVHTFNLYFPAEEFFDAHPEWYSLIDGQRKKERSQLCLTNPELTAAMIAKVRENIEISAAAARERGVPPPAVFSVSQNDWYNPCQCENCQAVTEAEGSEAGTLLQFVNQIADAVKDDYPWVYIDTLSYQYTLDPPKTIRPRDNVIIRLCDLSGPDQSKPVTDPANQTFYDAVMSWSKIAKNLRIWDYAVTYGVYTDLPYPSLQAMPLDLRFFLEHNAEGMFIEHEYPLRADLRDLKTWVEMKLLEDPYQDLETLITDFTDGYYGAAGPKVKAYVEALAAAAERQPSFIPAFGSPVAYQYLDLEFLPLAHRLFDEAEAAVAGDDELLQRVRVARLSLDRATLFRWRDLGREARVTGVDPHRLPLDSKAIAARAIATAEREAPVRLGGRADQILTMIRDQMSALSAIPAVVDPPRRFADLPPERVIDLTPDTFRLFGNQAKIVAAPDAELGAAARLAMSNTPEERRQDYHLLEQPMPWGIYDVGARKGVQGASLAAAEVPGPGFHWYTIQDVPIGEGCYAWFTWSWVIQVDLPVNDPDARYDVYASIKFEGPSFPHAQPGEENAISVERVVLVKR